MKRKPPNRLLALLLFKLIFILGSLAAVCTAEATTTRPRGWEAAQEGSGITAAHAMANEKPETINGNAVDTPPSLLLSTTIAFTLGILCGYLIHKQLHSRQELPKAEPLQQPAKKDEEEIESAAPPPPPQLQDDNSIVLHTEVEEEDIEEIIKGPGEDVEVVQQQQQDVASFAMINKIVRPGQNSGIVQEAAQQLSGLLGTLELSISKMDTNQRLEVAKLAQDTLNSVEARWRHEETVQLASQSNAIHAQHTHIVKDHVSHIKAKDAYELSLDRTREFRTACSDILYTGILVMLVGTAYLAWSHVGFEPFINRCGAFSLTGNSIGWGFWGGSWRAVERVSCYSLLAVDALIGIAVLLAAPWVLYRSGLMSDYHTMPVFRLLATLGVACGLAGYIAVSRIRGSAVLWLICWEIWVVMHIVLSSLAFYLNDQAIKKALAEKQTPESIYKNANTGWLMVIMRLVLGFALPAVTAWVPFYSPPLLQ